MKLVLDGKLNLLKLCFFKYARIALCCSSNDSIQDAYVHILTADTIHFSLSLSAYEIIFHCFKSTQNRMFFIFFLFLLLFFLQLGYCQLLPSISNGENTMACSKRFSHKIGSRNCFLIKRKNKRKKERKTYLDC